MDIMQFRMRVTANNCDENPTISQSDVASDNTIYFGFRKAVKIQNGNQTSGAGNGDTIFSLEYRFEHQDIATSGWNYTSSTSFITVQFWVKSSVAHRLTLVVSHHNLQRMVETN